jgi:hypothetical protein
LTGGGLETPLATLHELKTVYTYEDFFYFLDVIQKHNAEVKRQIDNMNRKK